MNKVIGIISIVFVFSLFVVPSINAGVDIEWSYKSCSNDKLSLGAIIYVNGTSFIMNETVECALGCAENMRECISSENTPGLFLTVTIALSIIIFVFAFLFVSLRDDHPPLSILFIFSAMIMIMALLGILMNANVLTQDGISSILSNVYIGFIYITMLFVAYFIYVLVKQSYENIKKSKEVVEDA